MILEEQKIIKVENLVGETEGFDMSLSADSMAWIMSMLSDLYKDPYSILPQEYISNAFDSHIEAKTKDPVVVQLKKDVNGKWYMAFQDFGIGLGPERIRIFGAYGKSTKKNSNDQLGAYGIGCKSYSAYTQTLFIDTVHEGISYNYLIHPNEEGIPRIELLHQEPSELSNRSKVWFNLKDNPSNTWGYRDTEQDKFFKGMRRKTCYFNNLVYDLDESLTDLNKNRRIEGKHFVYSENTIWDKMHILIGQVPYEIDFSLLGLGYIDVPVAVKVEGVFPTPTREAIKYTDVAITNIKEAIKLASTEIVQMYNKQSELLDDWSEWLNKLSKSPRIKLGQDTVYIDNLDAFSKVKIVKATHSSLVGIDSSNITASTIFPSIYSDTKIMNGRKGKNTNSSYYPRIKDYTCYSVSTQLNSKKNTYLGESASLIQILRRKNVDDEVYIRLLNLDKDDVDLAKIQQYRKFEDEVWESIPKYENVVIPDEYLKKAKVLRSSSKPLGHVTYYKIRRKMHGYGGSVMGEKDSTDDFTKVKRQVIYATRTELPQLENIHKLVNDKVGLIYIAQSNFKYLEELHQYVHMNDWHKTKSFSRVITAYKIQQMLKKHENLVGRDGYSSKRKDAIKDIVPVEHDRLKRLEDYVRKHLNSSKYSPDNKFMEDCIEVATTQKLWDYSIYHEIDHMDKVLDKLEFLKVFDTYSNYLPVAIGYIKKVTKNLRMDVKHYQHERI